MTTIDQAVERALAEAPPPTPEQLERLREILRPVPTTLGDRRESA